MTGSLLYLRAAVCSSGYRWSKVDASGRARWISKSFKVKAPPARKVVEAAKPDDGQIPAGYYLSSGAPFRLTMPAPEEPLLGFRIIEIGAEAPALFRELADTPITPEGIKQFANKWGLLRESVHRIIYFEDSREPIRHVGPIGDSAEEWAEAICEMRAAVAMWEWIKAEDADQLHRYLENLCEKYEKEKGWGAPRYLSDLKPETAVDTARIHLCGAVNSALEQRLSTRLSSSHSSTDGWNLYFEPECLLNGLWFQFLSAIRGNIEHRQCVVCAAWFEIATGSGRSDKRYCSVACQMRAYRKRKAGKP